MLHGEEERAFGYDRRSFPEIHLHELAGTQVRPRESGPFEVALDVFVHPREAEVPLVETDARFGPGELDDVANASLLGGVDEHALSLQHPLIAGRDQEDAVHAVQRGSQRLRPKHVALHDGERLERTCLRAVPDECPHRLLLAGKLADHGRSACFRALSKRGIILTSIGCQISVQFSQCFFDHLVFGTPLVVS